ncbi:hypothetical protein MMC29_000344 [Sticta canariensis]|nr:hypothetical protein [Sticta canariensis]
MYYLIFLQIVTTFITVYLSKNLKPYSLYDIKEFGRIAHNLPPLPPQVCFETSGDYADEYHLRSLSHLTVNMPSSLYSNNTDSFGGDQGNTETAFLENFTLTRLFGGMFHDLVQMASRFGYATVEVIVAFLHMLAAFGPVAMAAYALQEQRSQDWFKLQIRTVSSLANFWGLARTVEHQNRSIAVLDADLKRSAENLESARGRLLRLGLLVASLEAELKAREIAHLKERETFAFHKERLTHEGGALRRDHDALIQTIQNLQAHEKSSQDDLELTVKQKDKRIQHCEKALRAQQEDSSARFARYEAQIADSQHKLQATIVEAEKRFHAAQNTANERISELEGSLWRAIGQDLEVSFRVGFLEFQFPEFGVRHRYNFHGDGKPPVQTGTFAFPTPNADATERIEWGSPPAAATNAAPAAVPAAAPPQQAVPVAAPAAFHAQSPPHSPTLSLVHGTTSGSETILAEGRGNKIVKIPDSPKFYASAKGRDLTRQLASSDDYQDVS